MAGTIKFKKLSAAMLVAVTLLGVAAAGTASADANVPRRQARSIINGDSRTHVADTTAAPYSSVTSIFTHTGPGIGYAGSGAVIGRDTILSCGHLFGERPIIMDNDTYVAPGRDGNKMPYGKFKIKSFAIHPRYRTDSNHDIAIVIVEPNEKGQHIGDVVPRLKLNPSASINDAVTLPGYGGDKDFQMWTDKGRIAREDTYHWYHTADSWGGNSGGPLLNSRNEIIGVHVTSGNRDNGATKLTLDNYDFLKPYLDSNSTVPVEPIKPPVQEEAAAPTLIVGADKEITVGDTFNPLEGVRATDKIDGDITAKVKVQGAVNTAKAGVYTLTYTVTNSKGKSSTATRSITVKEKPAVSGDTWIASKIYNGGETVVYKGKTYKAKWWTQNNAPDTSAAWEQVVQNNADGSVDYIRGKAYVAGNIVKYNGHNYKAKWWTTSIPGSDSSWENL